MTVRQLEFEDMKEHQHKLRQSEFEDVNECQHNITINQCYQLVTTREWIV